MAHKVLPAALAAIALYVSAGSCVAFPANPIRSAENSSVQQVTFWARPFPYRYNWSFVRACTRYELLEGARGPRMHRIWVCDARRRYSLR
jgi:hypothetical protein